MRDKCRFHYSRERWHRVEAIGTVIDSVTPPHTLLSLAEADMPSPSAPKDLVKGEPAVKKLKPSTPIPATMTETVTAPTAASLNVSKADSMIPYRQQRCCW